ncbi:unnamed protein product [Gongylonema pulchrum]|uniref:Wax2_C domain-containing protein n=1 Tax=Gongylonema pulchrum TaxID=637853 RepID=A0A183E917_9BILA|nr:unnamed protein product [Gongylonema pulchrum]
MVGGQTTSKSNKAVVCLPDVPHPDLSWLCPDEEILSACPQHRYGSLSESGPILGIGGFISEEAVFDDHFFGIPKSVDLWPEGLVSLAEYPLMRPILLHCHLWDAFATYMSLPISQV